MRQGAGGGGGGGQTRTRNGRRGGTRKGVRELVKTKNELPVMSRTPRPSPKSTTFETQLPAIHAEQVEDDVAPVTTEYVPAKASQKAKRWGREHVSQ